MDNLLVSREVVEVPDYLAIKREQHTSWCSGDYHRVGIALQIVGEALCESMDIRSGETVLDVAAGTGNAALAAARRHCRVTATDFSRPMLDQLAVRAAAEGLQVSCEWHDMEDLPYADHTFDNVISTFGVMFAPDQVRVARELKRICSHRGKIAMASWTHSGFFGKMISVLVEYIPLPRGLILPTIWATDDFLTEHFGESNTTIYNNLRRYILRYPSPEYWLELFSLHYGPLHSALGQLDEPQAQSLRDELLNLARLTNTATDGTMVASADYAETIILKQ